MIKANGAMRAGPNPTGLVSLQEKGETAAMCGAEATGGHREKAAPASQGEPALPTPGCWTSAPGLGEDRFLLSWPPTGGVSL